MVDILNKKAMRNENDYKELKLFACYFLLSLIGFTLTDLLGHNSMGYRGAVAFDEIDWMGNCTCSLALGLFLTLLTHKSPKK